MWNVWAVPVTFLAWFRSDPFHPKSSVAFSEIDVSEDATAIYIQHGEHLEKLHQPFRRESRSAEAWAPEISTWRRFVCDGGRAFGSFEEERLVGIAVMRAALDKDTAQLAGLYVDSE